MMGFEQGNHMTFFFFWTGIEKYTYYCDRKILLCTVSLPSKNCEFQLLVSPLLMG